MSLWIFSLSCKPIENFSFCCMFLIRAFLNYIKSPQQASEQLIQNLKSFNQRIQFFSKNCSQPNTKNGSSSVLAKAKKVLSSLWLGNSFCKKKKFNRKFKTSSPKCWSKRQINSNIWSEESPKAFAVTKFQKRRSYAQPRGE